MNRTIKVLPQIRPNFFGKWRRTIERIGGFFFFFSFQRQRLQQGLEERKQIPFLLGPGSAAGKNILQLP